MMVDGIGRDIVYYTLSKCFEPPSRSSRFVCVAKSGLAETAFVTGTASIGNGFWK